MPPLLRPFLFKLQTTQHLNKAARLPWGGCRVDGMDGVSLRLCSSLEFGKLLGLGGDGGRCHLSHLCDGLLGAAARTWGGEGGRGLQKLARCCRRLAVVHLLRCCVVAVLGGLPGWWWGFDMWCFIVWVWINFMIMYFYQTNEPLQEYARMYFLGWYAPMYFYGLYSHR